MTYLESHGASSSRNFSFLRWNTLLTAEHMNRVIRVTLSRSNGSCNPPNSRRTLCRWFKWWIKSKIWGPSIGLAETIFCLKLSQIESKLLRNSRHSKRKWFTFSTFSLQIKQSAPSVFKSQGTPPLSSLQVWFEHADTLQDLGSCQLLTKTVLERYLLGTLGQHACLGGQCRIDTIHVTPSREF